MSLYSWVRYDSIYVGLVLETMKIPGDSILDITMDIYNNLYILAAPYAFVRVELHTQTITQINLLGVVDLNKNLDVHGKPKTRIDKGKVRTTRSLIILLTNKSILHRNS
jgi:hypothetical protein